MPPPNSILSMFCQPPSASGKPSPPRPRPANPPRPRLRRKHQPHALRFDAPPLFGLDWAWGAMEIKPFKRTGARFACRYLSYDPGKNLTNHEARNLSHAGIFTVVVWETTANRAAEGWEAGHADAVEAAKQADACGKPDGRPIYFAIDFDADGAQVDGYFAGARHHLGAHRMGAYGGIRPLRHLRETGLIDYEWQTYAWSGGAWSPTAQLHQYSNGHNVGGVDCDYNRSTRHDFGQWLHDDK